MFHQKVTLIPIVSDTNHMICGKIATLRLCNYPIFYKISPTNFSTCQRFLSETIITVVFAN